MSLIIRPYKASSKSAKALANALGVKRMAMQNSKWLDGPGKYVLNWGSNEIPGLDEEAEILNRPSSVERATNKKTFFEAIVGRIPAPAYWTNVGHVADFMEKKPGSSIVCRTMLRANSGRGIVIADNVEDLVDAPLYTLYIKKKFEYRIHVAFGKVIDVQQKARRLDIPDDQVNWKVRNHDNGFIFKREGVEVEDRAKRMAVSTVQRLNLHFGAVDIIYNEKKDEYFVLEVNTAPGLEGQTLHSYLTAFAKYV